MSKQNRLRRTVEPGGYSLHWWGPQSVEVSSWRSRHTVAWMRAHGPCWSKWDARRRTTNHRLQRTLLSPAIRQRAQSTNIHTYIHLYFAI